MKAIWLCNVPIPPISQWLGEEVVPFGGWLVGAAQAFMTDRQNSLVYIYPALSECREGEIGNLHFYSFRNTGRKGKDRANLYKYFQEILSRERGDILHIWGTEYHYSYTFMQAAKSLNYKERVVISIQGLISVYARHYSQKIEPRILYRRTLRDIVKNDSIMKAKRDLERRGIYEERLIQDADSVIGRTEWDKACTFQINRNMKYYECNETLRDSFYDNRWNLASCRRHTVFVSQGNSPIKGLNCALETIAILKKTYPDVKLVCAGYKKDKKSLIKYSSYELYIESLIKRYGLMENVCFTGILEEDKMVEYYLSGNVYLSSSSIENSSNSICEAMLLGMPIVASFVGGTPSLIKNEEEGLLYPFNEPYIAAAMISTIFSDDQFATNMGENARKRALIVHDKSKNYSDLIKIYTDIMSRPNYKSHEITAKVLWE
jgi:glycosyltransferase involved in cell wall biosynthesis